jgi:hypothetical protein
LLRAKDTNRPLHCSLHSILSKISSNNGKYIIFIITAMYVRKSHMFAFRIIAIIRTETVRPFATFAIYESRITNYHRPLSVMWRGVKPRGGSQLPHLTSRFTQNIRYDAIIFTTFCRTIYIKKYNKKNWKKKRTEITLLLCETRSSPQ